MKFTITVEGTFSAAHALRNYKGRCERLHGHNWKVQAFLSGAHLNKAGMLIDFTELKSLLNTILAPMDHRYLNEVAPFYKNNPTAENIAQFLFTALKKAVLKRKPRVRVAGVKVWESETSSASVRA